jgi:hypothetical protein
MQQIRRLGASIDRDGASSCGWPGGRATVGWGARRTGAPPPAGSCPTERPNPVHRAHTVGGPPPRDARRRPTIGTSGSARWRGRRSGSGEATAMKGRLLRWGTRRDPSADGRVGTSGTEPVADRRSYMTLLIVLALLIALDLAAWRWGHDSRDDQDWKT